MSQQRPGGRLPARVYWVRRFVVLGIPLLLVVLVVWLVAGRGSGGDTPAAASAQTTSPEPSPSKTPGMPECTADHLELAIIAAAVSFPAGASPTFALTITNTGTEPCLVDAGEAHRALVITSGSDRIWANQDCLAAGTESRLLLLAPGDEGRDTQQVTWNRDRSAPGCPAGLPTPGAGTYSLAFDLAGATTPPAVFGLG
jgi:hypothetical protein